MQSWTFANALSFNVFQNISNRETKFLSKQLYWNENNYLKQLLFCKNKFFRTPSCLEQLLLSNNSFLVTNTFYDLILFENKYFSARKKTEQVFLENCHFFSKKLVLLNQLHNIYTWKHFPLTMIYFFKYAISWSDFEIPHLILYC